MRPPCGMCGARAVEGAIVELNREIAQTILTEAGLQVVSVENGKLAADYMHSAMKSGMNGYLSKPLDVDKLYAMMRKCLK